MIFRKIATWLAITAMAGPALAGSNLPLVTQSGQTRQLPSGTTLATQPSTTGAASLNVPTGAAPTSPTDGDIWTTSTGVIVRLGGATRTILDSVSPISTQYSLSGVTSGTDYRGNVVYFPSDTVQAGSNFVVANYHAGLFGDASTTGGRVFGDFQLYQSAATSGSNPNRNYVALQGLINSSTGDGGSVGNYKGAYFGGSFAFRCGGTFILECSGGEVNSYAQTGTSISYKNLWSLVGGGPEDAVQGTDFDTMLALSNQTGSVKWKDGILVGNMNGDFPIASNGIVVATSPGSWSAKSGIDFSSVSFSDYILRGNNATISGTGYYSGSGITLTGPTPPLLFNDTSAGTSLKNWRFIPAAGILRIQAANDAFSTFTEAYSITEASTGVAQHTWSTSTTAGTPVTKLTLTNSLLTATIPVQLPAYTVSGLPTCNAGLKGAMAYVTDALAPSYNAALTGGGTVPIPVFCQGSAWTAH